MSKHKNRFSTSNLANDPLTKISPMSTQQRIDNNDVNSPGSTKKEISGIWPIIIFFGLLILIVILGWLTT